MLLVSLLALAGITHAAQAVTLEITINPTKINSFIEFKAESDHLGGEKATGHVTQIGAKTWKWDVGPSNQNIWFWWDTLDGDADLTISVDGTVVFQGLCSHIGKGEVKVKNTCSNPKAHKTEGSPRLKEYLGEPTFVLF